MTPTKIIAVSVISYVALFSVAYILFLNTRFTGDAAGSGMAKGLTLMFGLGLLFLLAIILTIVHIYFFEGTPRWVKLIAFVPILLPTYFFLTDFLEVGRPRDPSVERQAYRLTIEIKSATNLDNATLTYRSTSGSSSGKLTPTREEGGFYFYEKRNAFYFYEDDRKFYVHSSDFRTEEFYLVTPYEPEVIPFSDWKVVNEMKSNGVDSVKFEFRYKITL
jgi:hypothetical protein